MAAARAKNKKLEVVGGKAPKLSKAKLIKIYEHMLFLRRFQEKVGSLYQQGLMGGFCHLYDGQEAVITGAYEASQKGDEFMTTYRCHAHAVTCGVPEEDILMELMGRSGGISKGKGGSMHMFDPEKHFWGGHGIVTGNVPLGAGLAFAAKYRGESGVTLTFFGDGAANGGQMYESFNMAQLWKLPVLYIIENNQYSMGTALERHAVGDLYKRGEPFDIPGKRVDGMDFFAVYEAMAEALAYVRAGNGPMLLEMDTYRYKGHSLSDPGTYRTRDEVNEIKEQRDPLVTMVKTLQEKHGVTDAQLKTMNKKAKERVAKAEEIAKAAPVADESELYTDILAE